MAHISEAAPLQISRFYTGWYTYRNPLIVPIRQVGRRIIELYDAISDGLNMECSNRLTLVRRPGYTLISPVHISGQSLYFYSFKPSNFPGQVYPIIDTTTVIGWFQANEATKPDAYSRLVTKATPALSNFSTVGAYCYMAQELVASKWDSPGGVQGVTNWGIPMFDSGHNKGPNLSTNMVNIAANQPYNVPWTISGQSATVTLTPSAAEGVTMISDWLQAGAFNIVGLETSVQDFEVSGLVVTLHGVTARGSDGIGFHVRMVRNGTLYGVYRNVTLPANQTDIVIGTQSDTWDGAWQLGDLQTAGVAVQAVNSSNAPAVFALSGISLTVYYNSAPPLQFQASPPGPLQRGGITAEIGYRYKYCYGNSYSGHISSPSMRTWYPGPTGSTVDGLIVPTNQVVLVYLAPSTDPQVTDIHVFRSTDGGGEPFFELPNSPVPNNLPVDGTGHIEFPDFSPDNDLQIANICPDPHFNDPPPGGMLDPVWYAGRLWGHRGNQLFFASGPDVSMGNGEEAWYPVYRFAMPNGQIVRKFPTPNGLLLVLNDDISIARGISTASFTVTDFAKDIGMRSWLAGDSDGTNIYIYTSDRQFLMVAPNGLTSISANIADQIQVVDPTKAYVAQYRYTAKENLIFVGDGSTTLYPYNQELQAWNTVQVPVQGVGAIGSVEVSPGVYQFWRSRPILGAGPGLDAVISFRDVNSYWDEDEPYPCSVTFGCIPLADLLTVAQVRDIALKHASTTSRIILSAMANEIFPIAGKQFEILQISSSEPPELSATPSLSFTGNRYTWMSTPLPEHVNELFFRIDWSADPNPDELYIWTLGGTQTTGGSALGPPGQLPQLQGR